MTTNSIWKFILEPTDTQSIDMPLGARILSVDMQNSRVCLWAQVNPEAKIFARTIEIFGTGHPIEISDKIVREFIGTVLWPNGHLVFHVFERLAP